MIKTFKYRIYPTPQQEAQLNEWSETLRRFWNRTLAAHNEAYERDPKRVTVSATGKYQPDKYDFGLSNSYLNFSQLRKDCPYAAKVPFKFFQTVATDMSKSFKLMFRNLKAGAYSNSRKPRKDGKPHGHPRFKRYGEFVTIGSQNKEGLRIVEDGDKAVLRVSKVGDINIRYHRPINGQPKSFRITKVVDKWFVSIAVDVGEPEPLPSTGKMVGVDRGIAYIAVTSDGVFIDNPHWYVQSMAKRRRLQRAFSRKEKGSYRWKQLKKQIAKHDHHIANQRRDFMHKLSRQLVNGYDLIAVEDLNIKGMVKSRLSKSIADAGWGMLSDSLSYKADEAGRVYLKVDPKYTSQICYECGHQSADNRKSQSVFCCEKCGHCDNADVNAAKNILARAL